MRTYTDLGLRDRPIVYDAEAVTRAVTNIIQTPKRALWGKPEFGSDTRKFIFDPADEVTAQEILFELLHDIRKWEPRVNLKFRESSVTMDADENTVYINLVIEIYGEISIVSMSLPVVYS